MGLFGNRLLAGLVGLFDWLEALAICIGFLSWLFMPAVCKSVWQN